MEGELFILFIAVLVVVDHDVAGVSVEAIDVEAVGSPVQAFGQRGDGVVLPYNM